MSLKLDQNLFWCHPGSSCF